MCAGFGDAAAFRIGLAAVGGSGEVPCQDREGALTALRTRPIETFDFHHPNAVTAHWARENFEVLGQRLSMELAQRCDLPVREIAFWVDALFRFAATPVENPGRVRVLAEAVHAGNPGEGVLMERLEALLGLLALLMRVVLVADDLKVFPRMKRPPSDWRHFSGRCGNRSSDWMSSCRSTRTSGRAPFCRVSATGLPIDCRKWSWSSIR